jgi:hypothetical protein
MNHTIGRHRRLYGLLRDTGTQRYRHDLVLSFSHGRTDNSAELTDQEVDDLINHLSTKAPEKHGPTRSGVDYKGQQMRRRILSLCHTIGWNSINPQTSKHEIDWDRLNGWMSKYGYLHKKLNEYTFKELPRLVTQFEHMVKTTLK